ncbi:SET domain-containing protein-lysine N-methyltransferase [Ferruginibacter albus]|uniref:SET domain-containing protein-lysine N-methyltransferase n=1 Tax=Ferruginibacter albus TaxID=2875540 RepID=UPI001CC612B4|nr:SET domain-containing protein-lysine N-methyltransferase [Ferruginibacter albus]UAY52061.1 SET domain-containing protein-lysine N-methyltransferase [Ferruginibacter albus]
MIAQTTNPAVQVLSNHAIAEVWQNASTNQKSLHALRQFKPGDVISRFHAGTLSTTATYLTVQVGIDRHITLQPEFLQYINHSCEPNVFFNTTTMQVVCLREINVGEELTFFYPSTEWDMVQPFVCNCGSKDCLQLINGASHLSMQTIKKYRVTDFIQQQCNLKRKL